MYHHLITYPFWSRCRHQIVTIIHPLYILSPLTLLFRFIILFSAPPFILYLLTSLLHIIADWKTSYLLPHPSYTEWQNRRLETQIMASNQLPPPTSLLCMTSNLLMIVFSRHLNRPLRVWNPPEHIATSPPRISGYKIKTFTQIYLRIELSNVFFKISSFSWTVCR